GSRNAGAREAKGEALIFVDADTIVPDELLSKTLQALQGGKVCGGGTLVSFDAEHIPLPLRIFCWLWHFLIRLSPLAAGSYVFCLKDAWAEVGGFDEKVYASEEIWFSRALRRWGRKRKMTFVILDVPVVTSARKMRQFSTWHIFFMFLLIMVYPPGVKNRRICHMWYRREDSK
ncbi:MAG: glycosyltransferase, partial [Victivallales bacterium]|nr:glycosyltransferase [Victivallales bacterium]